MWTLYQACYALCLAVAAPYLLAARGRHYLPTIAPRFGRYRGAGGDHALWLHAVSVGEVGVAATLAQALLARLPPQERVLLTTITPTGQERARAETLRPELEGRLTAAYLPFDLGLAVDRFLDRFSPKALVLVEGDLWPLLLRRVRERGARTVVVNGRISDRSFSRQRKIRRLVAPLYRPVEHFGVQTGVDRDRLLALGVEAARVTVTGNLKFDTPEPTTAPDAERRIAEFSAGRPVLLAGSTVAGEEELVLEAFERSGDGRRALLLLAPRHPERFAAVTRLVESRGLRCLRRSAGESSGSAHEERPDVLILDTLGELAGLYRVAAAAFVGGTLVPKGGHNPLEPARFGVPVAVGPSMENFREMALSFDAAGAWRRVRDPAELAQVWRGWLDDPASARAQGELGRAQFLASRGALARTLELLEPLLRAS